MGFLGRFGPFGVVLFSVSAGFFSWAFGVAATLNVVIMSESEGADVVSLDAAHRGCCFDTAALPGVFTPARESRSLCGRALKMSCRSFLA